MSHLLKAARSLLRWGKTAAMHERVSSFPERPMHVTHHRDHGDRRIVINEIAMVIKRITA